MSQATPGTANNGQGCPTVAFTCGQCHEAQGDPLFTGPAGHAPSDICFHCWLAAWEDRHGTAWSPQITALWRLSCGDTLTLAAELAGVSRRTLYRWLCGWRQDLEGLPPAIRMIFDVDCVIRAVRKRREAAAGGEQ